MVWCEMIFDNLINNINIDLHLLLYFILFFVPPIHLETTHTLKITTDFINLFAQNLKFLFYFISLKSHVNNIRQKQKYIVTLLVTHHRIW